MASFWGEQLRYARTRERERKKRLLFLIDWEDGVFGLLTLCHLSKTCVQVMCYKFLSNITMELTTTRQGTKCNKCQSLECKV